MVYVSFGNLTVKEMGEKLGITFTEEHLEYLESYRQDKTELEDNHFHIFSAPFSIDVKGYCLANKIKVILSKYDLKSTVGLVVNESKEDLEDEIKRIQSGLGGDLYYSIEDCYGLKVRYFKKVKENKKTFRIQQMRTFNEEDKRLGGVLNNDYIKTDGELEGSTILVDKETFTTCDKYNRGKKVSIWDGNFFKTDWENSRIYRMTDKKWALLEERKNV